MLRSVGFFLLLMPCLLNAREGVAVIPFEVSPSGHLMVEVSINCQQSQQFLIDTAAGISLLDTDAARRLGVDFRPRRAKGSRIGGVGGSSRQALREVEIDELEVGMAIIYSPEFYATDLRKLGKMLKANNLIGILGTDFLRSYHGVVDYSSQTLTLAWR